MTGGRATCLAVASGASLFFFGHGGEQKLFPVELPFKPIFFEPFNKATRTMELGGG